MRTLVKLGIVALLAAPVLAQAEEFPGDPEAGRKYAEKVCVPCHNVDSAAETGHAPSFHEIAAKPGMTPMALIAWLRGVSHPTMPNLILSDEDARNVVAYILSLEKKPQRGIP